MTREQMIQALEDDDCLEARLARGVCKGRPGIVTPEHRENRHRAARRFVGLIRHLRAAGFSGLAVWHCTGFIDPFEQAVFRVDVSQPNRLGFDFSFTVRVQTPPGRVTIKGNPLSLAALRKLLDSEP